MDEKQERQTIEKDILREILIKSLQFPRFDTLQEYLRQRADVSYEEFQEIRYQIGVMTSSERMQYVSRKEYIAERKREFFKSALPELLIKDVDETEIRMWIETGGLREEEVEEARIKAAKIKNDMYKNE